MTGDFNLEKMISRFSCADCGTRFRAECIKAFELQFGVIVLKIVCRCCGKSYAIVLSVPETEGADEIRDGSFLPVKSEKTVQKRTPQYFEQFSPISYDDVLEAHEFIQNFEENWRRFIDSGNYNPI